MCQVCDVAAVPCGGCFGLVLEGLAVCQLCDVAAVPCWGCFWLMHEGLAVQYVGV